MKKVTITLLVEEPAAEVLSDADTVSALVVHRLQSLQDDGIHVESLTVKDFLPKRIPVYERPPICRAATPASGNASN